MITSYLNLLVIKLFIDCNFLFKWFNELHFWVGSLVAQTVKNLPAIRETWVPSLGGEDPMKKEMATHSSILVWRIPRTEERGGLQSMGGKESDTTEQLRFHFSELNVTNVSYSMPRFLAANGRSECCLWEVAKGKTLTWFRVTHSTNRKAREHITENCSTNTWVKAAENSAGVTAGLLVPCVCTISCFCCVWLCATLWDYAAAAAAKSLQSCPILCDPIDGSQPGSPVLGILWARTLEWVAISFSNAGKWKAKVKLLSSPPGSCIHGILKARVLTWVAMPSSRESSEPTDWICVSWVSCGFFTTSATYYS